MNFYLSTCLFIISFIFGNSSFAIDIKEELSNLNISDQGVLKEADFSDSLIQFANDNDKPLNLTSGDRQTLKLLGYSDAEIDELSVGSFVDNDGRKKFTDRLTTYGNKKNKEIEAGVKESLVPGLGSSVVGLSLTSLLGITVGVRCSSQPSALAFAGASAAWVGLEMMIWKGYQVNMKDIETLSEISKIPGTITKKVERVKVIIKDIENDFEESDLKDINVFLDSKQAEVNELKGIAEELRVFLQKAKDKQFGALSSIQKSIALAAETSKKKARNAKVAAIGFTAAAGVAAMEAFNVFGGSGNCFESSVYNQKTDIKALANFMAALFFRDAHAGFASVGDLDKIGIPVGAGLAAAYLGYKKTFADKIYASGASRSVVFVAMAGLAYYASKKLQEAAKFLDKQAKEMKLFVDTVENLVEGRMVSFPSGEALIDSLKNDLLPSLEELIKTNVDVDQVKEDLADLGEELGVSSQEELEALATEELQGVSDKDILKELETFGASKEDLNSLEGSEFVGMSRSKSYLERILEPFVSNAYAKKRLSSARTETTCFYRTKTFLRENQSCSCRKSRNCARSLFPKSIKMSANAKQFGGLYQFALRADQANNLIMQGHPAKGIQLYRGLYSKVRKVNGMTRSMISKKIGKSLNTSISARMTKSLLKVSKPALVDYYKKRKLRKAPIERARKSPLLSKELKKKNHRQQQVRAKLQKHFLLAKALNNPKLKDVEFDSDVSSGVEYAYDQESIVRDKTKNIFNIIKRRYLMIMQDGRL